MFGILGSKSGDDFNLNDVGGIQKLIRKKGIQEASVALRNAAEGGNLTCQIFLSQLGLQIPAEKRTAQITRDIERFTTLAAEAGDPDSQFNLAILLFQKVDSSGEYITEEEFGFIMEAKSWHRKAASKGYKPSIQALKRLECFPD